MTLIVIIITNTLYITKHETQVHFSGSFDNFFF